MALLTCKNLTLGYDSTVVAENINFEVNTGDYLCIIGENGSGKTTLIKLFNDLLTITSGQILINGKEVGVDSKKIISYLPERTYLDKSMTVKKAVEYFSDFYENFDSENLSFSYSGLILTPFTS